MNIKITRIPYGMQEQVEFGNDRNALNIERVSFVLYACIQQYYNAINIKIWPDVLNA